MDLVPRTYKVIHKKDDIETVYLVSATSAREYAECANADRDRTFQHEVRGDRECARILKKLDAGEMAFEAEPYDIEVITKCLPWASNGGFQ